MSLPVPAQFHAHIGDPGRFIPGGKASGIGGRLGSLVVAFPLVAVSPRVVAALVSPRLSRAASQQQGNQNVSHTASLNGQPEIVARHHLHRMSRNLRAILRFAVRRYQRAASMAFIRVNITPLSFFCPQPVIPRGSALCGEGA